MDVSSDLCNFATKILLLLGVGITSIEPCLAQSNIAPDNTLGSEASQITPNVNNLDGIESELIEGGAERGENLFHSFQEFNVGEGRGAYFVVPNNTIQNILTRVTGSNASQILGILGTISDRSFSPSDANLFLINPNGIVFGANASLDINASFVGTTANAVEFGGEGFFSATNPQAPGRLLTVNPSAFLFNQINSQASIQSRSVAPAGESLSGNSLKGLRVGNGENLFLLGGNLNIDGGGEEGGISAIGGRVELGGLASAGTVGLNRDGNLSLSFPDGVERSDIRLSNSSKVVVAADDGGNIAFNSGNVELIEGSSLLAGISPGLGSPGSQAGNIQINATRIVVIDGISNGFLSGAFNQVEAGSTGNSGRIEINGGSVEIKNGAQLNVGTLGNGNSGTIRIDAADRVVFDGAPLGFRSSALSQVGANAVGNSGGIEINSGTVEVTDGGYLETNTLGQGNAGKIQITARDRVVIDGQSPLGFLSTAFSQVGENALGNSGGIEINSGTVEVTNGGQLSANTLGRGDAGKVSINAVSKAIFDGMSPFGFLSSAFSQVGENALGNSGGIEINAGDVEVTNGAQLSATTLSQGDAGIIRINATERVVFDGESPFSSLSAAISQVFTGAEGDSKGIEINAATVEITNGAQLSATSLGRGNSGLIKITGTERVIFDGESSFGSLSTAISQVFTGAEGDSKGIEINAGTFEVTNGGQLSANTLGTGNAGAIKITAREKVIFDGESGSGFLSSAFSQVRPGVMGNSGGIVIEANNVEITNGALLDASTLGAGNAGAVQITGRDRVVFEGESQGGSGSYASSLVTTEAEGNSGGIIINAGIFELMKGAQLITTTLGRGNSGTIQLTATDRVVFDGKSPNGDRSSAVISEVGSVAVGNSRGIEIDTPNLRINDTAFVSANTFGDGNAGGIAVNSNNLELTDSSTISARSQGTGISGDININLKDNFNADNGQVITRSQNSSGGNINITAAKNIFLRNNSDINTILSTTDSSGGDINLKANAILALEDSDIFAFAPDGRGGNINFDTRAFLSNPLYRPTAQTSDRAALDRLDGNNLVDVNASGGISAGTIDVPDISFLQNSLAQLAESPIDSEALVASSCVVRSNQRNGSFFITGQAGLPYRPGDAVPSAYPAVEVRSVTNNTSSTDRKWKIGQPIVEPSGIYRLANGQPILSRECGK